MALVKEYLNNKGAISYWVVSLIQIDNFSKTAYVRLCGFYSKEQANLQNPTAIQILEVNVTPDIYDYYFSKKIMIETEVTPQTQAYQIFKDFYIEDTQGGVFNFSDAVNDIEV